MTISRRKTTRTSVVTTRVSDMVATRGSTHAQHRAHTSGRQQYTTEAYSVWRSVLEEGDAANIVLWSEYSPYESIRKYEHSRYTAYSKPTQPTRVIAAVMVKQLLWQSHSCYESLTAVMCSYSRYRSNTAVMSLAAVMQGSICVEPVYFGRVCKESGEWGKIRQNWEDPGIYGKIRQNQARSG